MTDDEHPLPGFPGGHVPIVGEVTGDGEVRPAARQTTNGGLTCEESRALWGPHPADNPWRGKYRGRRR